MPVAGLGDIILRKEEEERVLQAKRRTKLFSGIYNEKLDFPVKRDISAQNFLSIC